MFKRRNKKEIKSTYKIIDNLNSHIDYKEVYRNIRTNIKYTTVGKDIQVINITSTKKDEGKSTTALNLAMIYAAKYKNVLLIDADLRRPVQHQFLRLSNANGLTNAIVDFDKNKVIDEKYFQKINDESFEGKLTVLTSGIKVPNPSELLGREVFKEFIDELKKRYDFIIIDCPPVLIVSDAIPIGNIVDGTIFVCSSKVTNRKEAQTAVNVLKKNNVNILGSIVTQVESGIDSYNQYYYY